MAVWERVGSQDERRTNFGAPYTTGEVVNLTSVPIDLTVHTFAESPGRFARTDIALAAPAEI